MTIARNGLTAVLLATLMSGCASAQNVQQRNDSTWTVTRVHPPIDAGFNANPAAFPRGMKPEDLDFYSVSPLRYSERDSTTEVPDYRKAAIIKRLGSFIDSLSGNKGIARNWDMEVYPEDSLTQKTGIPVRYEQSNPTLEEKINSKIMQRFMERYAGNRNFMAARNAQYAGKDRAALMHDYNPGTGLIFMTGTASGPGCEPCRYVVFSPKQ